MNNPLFFTSPRGISTCKINGKLLHSSYNPNKEAQNTITQQLFSPQNKDKNPKIFVIVGAAMGYENNPIIEQYPDATIISIYLHTAIYMFSKKNYMLHNKNYVAKSEEEIFSSGNIIHYNHNNKHTYTVLQSLLRQFSLQEIIVLHWNPSLSIWTKQSKEVLKIIKEVLELFAAERITETFFVKRWISNAVFHYKNTNASYVIEKASSLPAVVIGAGPSLLYHTQYLKTIRPHIIIIATSSSLECLYANDIIPDIIVHQDASFYAQKHLHIHYLIKEYISKIPKPQRPYVAMPISAARTHLFYKNNEKIIILHTNDFPEILLALNPSHIQLSYYATVMGTAIELAWNVTKNTVYIVGFDVSTDICGSHCYPHTNYSSERNGNRISTLDSITRKSYINLPYSLSITRYNHPIKQDSSLAMYEKWFTHWKDNRKKTRTILLTKNNGAISHMLTMNFLVQTHIPINRKKESKAPRIFFKQIHHNYNKKTLQKHIHTWENILKDTLQEERSSSSSEIVRHKKNNICKDTVLNVFGKLTPIEQTALFQKLRNIAL